MSCDCQAIPAAPDISCEGAEVFALQVLGGDMQPEFDPGDIVIIEPGGALGDGCFVLAQRYATWLLRQLTWCDGRWWLRALSPTPGNESGFPLPDLSSVRGVVIQKAVPGRRRASKFYI